MVYQPLHNRLTHTKMSIKHGLKLMHSHCRTKSCIKIPSPIVFDVSMRDGIQGANPIDYPSNKKLDILSRICKEYSPHKIEVGSFVSPKVLPIMGDTAKIFKAMPVIFEKTGKTADIYALVPNKVGLLNAIQCGFTNFSFITSVSNAFQLKNTGKNLLHKKTELQEMMNYISTLATPSKTKLYVSCVNECPIAGVIDRDWIIHEILYSYGRLDLSEEYDEICISDTMGTLKHRDFEYIANGLTRFGLTPSRLSIHLHINSENEQEAKRILFECFRRGINKFDVSVVSDGGCSVTMDANKLKPNMTYEFLHSALEEYKELIGNGVV